MLLHRETTTCGQWGKQLKSEMFLLIFWVKYVIKHSSVRGVALLSAASGNILSICELGSVLCLHLTLTEEVVRTWTCKIQGKWCENDWDHTWNIMYTVY